MERCPVHGMQLALIILGGCLQPSSIDCDNGGVCPPEFLCANVHDAFNKLPGDPGNMEVCVPQACQDIMILHGKCVHSQSHDGCSSHCSSEQPLWTTIEAAPLGRTRHAMAYDAARGRLVLFGGDLPPNTGVPSSPCSAPDDLATATWEWDGAVWRKRTPPTVPPPRAGHAMAYDASRERVVMFGGDSASAGSTWEWDGNDWSEHTSATAPPAWLVDAAMTYDAGRRRVVLFGGDHRGGKSVHDFQGRTWEWDGDNWSEIHTMTSPPSRAAAAMAYDSKRGRVVLFGGVAGTASDSVSLLNDTWEFDGDTWVQASATDSPEPREHAGMVFDARRGKIVMFGGATEAQPSPFFADTWEWDGSHWTTNTVNATAVAPQMAAPMAYDLMHGRVVLFGGSDDGKVTNEMWEWDGDVWIQRAVGCASTGSDGASTLSERPPPRSGLAMAYDTARATAVLFGGRQGNIYLSDTWLWNGSEWHAQAPTRSPPARAGHAMAFDAARNVIVMFGGTDADPSDPGAPPRFDDTWEWDGTSWTQLFPTTRPTARSGHAMVYDALRNTILLIGGNASESGFLEQCEWDGVNWTCRTPASSPSMRTDFAVASDVANRQLVLFGGKGKGGLLQDTWVWKGSTWIKQPFQVDGPAARRGHMLGYDAMRKSYVLFGGQTDFSSLSDAWEWKDQSWTQISPPTSPTTSARLARHQGAMVYDVARERLIIFGGDDQTPAPLGDTWYLRYEDPAAPDEECHTGLDYDGDGLAGCDDPDCAGLCTRCGDDVCDVSEDCGLCPGDCGVCGSVCGDLQCDLGETPSSCPGDCGPGSVCGDRVCDPRETCSMCPQDCGACN